MKLYRETTKTEKKKQCDKDNNRRHNKVSENVVFGTEKMDRRIRRSRDYDHDVMFFSSTSLSSDSSSSSGGFSSSDTESLYGTRTRSSSSCFAPPRPKPVRTSMSFRYEEQGSRRFHSFRHDSNTELGALIGDHDDDQALSIKSKSRALKIYNNLKKVKQPISPGGKITSFLNSIFASSKKTRSTNHDINNNTTTTTTTKSCPIKRGRLHESDDTILSYKNVDGYDRKAKLVQASMSSSSSSSFSSFSRSCLSKTNSSERDKLCNGVKRTVRFYPVSVVVGEDCRPCGHKRVCEEQGKVPTTWKINSENSSPKKNTVVEKRRVVEEAAREFLEEYHRNNNHKKMNDVVLKEFNLPISTKINANEDYDDDDVDVASCASSDLFELDHLAVFGNGRYCEELPVYETTHVSANRAIANGLIV